MTKQLPVSVAVKREKKLVVLKFDRDVNYIEMDPGNARDIACAMTDVAFEADTGLKPAGETLKAALVERHHDTLVPRIALMLASLRENKLMSNGDVARRITEVCLAEVFK
jgi:hypothetical protein